MSSFFCVCYKYSQHHKRRKLTLDTEKYICHEMMPINSYSMGFVQNLLIASSTNGALITTGIQSRTCLVINFCTKPGQFFSSSNTHSPRPITTQCFITKRTTFIITFFCICFYIIYKTTLMLHSCQNWATSQSKMCTQTGVIYCRYSVKPDMHIVAALD